ncbi:heterokaryon incompatibility protein-domain-containing protein [Phyllosticta capitalensis]|uniref:Heterokaryon incompatibility protein-domain-containing protein n=1 Tax=Phyllosticta capitalensis TaxID=121624 RepID=A0ABR1YNS1_9PEZI
MTKPTGDRIFSLCPDSTVPLIDFTHIANNEGTLVRKSLLDKCRLCGWDGESRIFDTLSYHNGHVDFTFQDIQAESSQCLSCRVRLLVLKGMARCEGECPAAMDRCGIDNKSSGFVNEARYTPSYLKNGYFCYDLFTSPESPSSEIDQVAFPISRRTITWDATTNDSLERSTMWAQSHISECLLLHDLCAIPNEFPVIPTRLIDVSPDGNGSDVRLQDCTLLGTSLEYAALSYCWGGYEPKCTTTNKTLQTNLHGISWDLLPQTFRDAVKVTRGLGLKYLWIDSLCIIQGNEKDWCKESGRMFDVYKGAKVTLAALFGENPTTGLRVATMKQQIQIVANLQLGQSSHPLYIRRHHYLWYQAWGWREMMPVQKINYPLLKRAWTFQERIISPRVLFFTQDEVIYQCASKVKCECGSATRSWGKRAAKEFSEKTGITKATQLKEDRKAKGTLESFGKTQKRDNDKKRDKESFKIQETWRRVTTSYSDLDLTKKRDRLAAIAAIAEQFQRVRLESKYLAGLWSDSLPDDLIWMYESVGDPRETPSSHKKEKNRPFNLPTWSWASIHGPITYFGEAWSTYLVEIVEARCRYADDNHFGALESSTLVLKSRVVHCTLRYDHLRRRHELGSGYNNTWEWDNSRVFMDYDEDHCLGEPQVREVYLLQVKEWIESPGADIFCLILHLEDQDACIYSRLGVMAYRGGVIAHAFQEKGQIVECEIR